MTERRSWIGNFAAHGTAANLPMLILIFVGLLAVRSLRPHAGDSANPRRVVREADRMDPDTGGCANFCMGPHTECSS